jgi:hypothetical protein
VNDLCRNYPEFNLAHMLKVRIREYLGQEKEKELKVAAVYSSDRKKLYQLVTGVAQVVVAKAETEVPKAASEVAPEAAPEAAPEEMADVIEFSDEPYVHADVIIEQHAPYAAPPGAEAEAEEDLLELEEEADRGDSFILDTTQDELSSETLIQNLVKEESEMEEPASGLSDTPAIDVVEEEEPLAVQEEPKDVKDDLIRQFIKGDPGPIRADRKTSLKGDVSVSSIKEHDGFITDTLAKIYVKQGLVAKAIYAYEKLSLKYPEKSAYFAAQIEKVKNINHS